MTNRQSRDEARRVLHELVQNDLIKLRDEDPLSSGTNSAYEEALFIIEEHMYKVTLDAYIESHKQWLQETFGVDEIQPGLIKHIKKELDEIEENPYDSREWTDLCILALQGLYLSLKHHPSCAPRNAIWSKHKHNMYERKWNNTGDPNEPIEHVREDDDRPSGGGDWSHMGETNIRTMELRPEDRLCPNGQLADCGVYHRLNSDGSKLCIKCGMAWDHYGGRIA